MFIIYKTHVKLKMNLVIYRVGQVLHRKKPCDFLLICVVISYKMSLISDKMSLFLKIQYTQGYLHRDT